jgi:hypothetical protein
MGCEKFDFERVAYGRAIFISQIWAIPLITYLGQPLRAVFGPASFVAIPTPPCSPSSEGSEEVVILVAYESGAVELCAGVL